jgi:tRNA threonylcarbamoyl adenosine modification protein YeaZ
MAGIEPATLSGIVIGNGPGSFTGLRIGYTFIKGLSLGLRLPVAQLSSMKATAQAALEHHGLEYHGVSAVLADARRDECFVSAYQRSPNGQLLELLAPQILARAQIEGVVKRLSAGQGIRWIFEPELGWGVPGVPPAGVARGLLEILEDEDIHEFSVDTLSAIHPQYLRAVAAKTILERSK